MTQHKRTIEKVIAELHNSQDTETKKTKNRTKQKIITKQSKNLKEINRKILKQGRLSQR